MNEKEFKELLSSTEFLARITIGQFNRIEDALDKVGYLEYEEIERKERELKKYVFPELDPRGSYSIGGERVNETGKVAWEIHCMMRYYQAWKEHPEGGMGVNFYKPLKITEEPFIEIKESDYVEFEKITEKHMETMLKAKVIYEALRKKESKPLIDYLIEIGGVKDEERKEKIEKNIIDWVK